MESRPGVPRSGNSFPLNEDSLSCLLFSFAVAITSLIFISPLTQFFRLFHHLVLAIKCFFFPLCIVCLGRWNTLRQFSLCIYLLDDFSTFSAFPRKFSQQKRVDFSCIMWIKEEQRASSLVNVKYFVKNCKMCASFFSTFIVSVFSHSRRRVLLRNRRKRAPRTVARRFVFNLARRPLVGRLFFVHLP